MTTPADIAAALTAPQIRALKDPNGCADNDWYRLCDFEMRTGVNLTKMGFDGLWTQTPLGLAVLTELERIEIHD